VDHGADAPLELSVHVHEGRGCVGGASSSLSTGLAGVAGGRDLQIPSCERAPRICWA
jgi:hypothetical protein